MNVFFAAGLCFAFLWVFMDSDAGQKILQNGSSAAENKESGTGHYRIGEYEFAFPKNYLWQRKHIEGVVDDLYLMVRYPTFDTAQAEFVEPGYQDELKITLEYYIPNEKSSSDDLSWIKYNSRVLIPLDGGSPASESKGGFNYFEIPAGINPDDTVAVYYRGDRGKPSTWHLCYPNVASPSCYTTIEILPRLWATLTFSARYEGEIAQLTSSTTAFILAHRKN